jgi:hypothetical protein
MEFAFTCGECGETLMVTAYGEPEAIQKMVEELGRHYDKTHPDGKRPSDMKHMVEMNISRYE